MRVLLSSSLSRRATFDRCSDVSHIIESRQLYSQFNYAKSSDGLMKGEGCTFFHRVGTRQEPRRLLRAGDNGRRKKRRSGEDGITALHHGCQPPRRSTNHGQRAMETAHFSSLQIPRLWRRILEISNSNFGVYLYLDSKTRANIIVNALLLPFRNLMRPNASKYIARRSLF